MLLLRGCHCRLIRSLAAVRQARATRLWARPTATHLAGTGADLVRTRGQVLAENALLRQQLVVLRRGVTRPAVAPTERALLVLLAGRVRAWRQALLLVQPDTLLRWHRAGFRARWRRKSRPGPGRPPLPAETVALIRRMAGENPRRGAERSRGALGKLGLRVAKRTIQGSLRGAASPQPRGQTWAAFLRNHAPDIWAGAFLPVTDLACRPLFAFFISELATRRVVHVGATRHPTDAWVAQPLREATPFGVGPRYLIRDNDGKCGAAFARVAAASGSVILRTPYRAPRANATGARFRGSVRRECLDHVLVLGARHLARVLREYVASCNRARPHQGRGQARPEPSPRAMTRRMGPSRAVPVLGGLHHTYHAPREADGRFFSQQTGAKVTRAPPSGGRRPSSPTTLPSRSRSCVARRHACRSTSGSAGDASPGESWSRNRAGPSRSPSTPCWCSRSTTRRPGRGRSTSLACRGRPSGLREVGIEAAHAPARTKSWLVAHAGRLRSSTLRGTAKSSYAAA